MNSKGYISNLDHIGTKVSEGQDVPLPKEHEYDVVVVGGGTSGCALAARLSEEKSIRVLLLEAGRSGAAIPATRVPAGFLQVLRTDDCFNYYTEPQHEADGGKKYWPRAKLLGGCSSINAMMFQTGAPDDFDEWAKLGGPGAESWKWSEIQKYFKKFEKYIPSKRFPDVDPSLRGSDGPMEISFFGNFSKVSEKFLDACKEIGIPYKPDINTSAGCIGTSKCVKFNISVAIDSDIFNISTVTYITSKGRRVSTETAYLTPDVLTRPNLTVATEAIVTKILFDTSGETPRVSGVEFARTKDGPRYRVGVRKEVVVCGGAICTPTILMHSGIGPAAELTKHSIPVIVDLPGVGAHLQDHPLVPTRYRAKANCESISFLASRTLAEKAKALLAKVQYLLYGTGPLTCNLGEVVTFVRSDDPKLFPVEEGYVPIEDSTSGSNAPDIEIFSTPAAWKDHGFGGLPPGQLFSITAYLLRPTSYGTITLRSADPFDDPIIDPKYLSTQHDVDVLVRGLKLIAKMMQTKALASMVAPDDDPALDHELHKADDAKLEQIVRERVETIYHPTGTARMGTRESGGVVDAELRVHGVQGLRVCDASIFPSIISGHTSAACIATAEKAADLIKAALSV